MTYKKYDKYKNSGISWIGNIPEEWTSLRLKDFISIFQKSNIPAGEGEDKGLYPFYTSSQELTKRIDIALFDSDAITMATGGMASVNYVGEKYSSSTDCFNFTTKQNTKFISYYLFSIKDSVINNLWFSGMGMKHLQKDELLSSSIYFPKQSEQQAIAKYLDERTENIDKRIDLLQQKSEKYKTLRKNLISHVITHGLNPNVKMKDSGINVLGKIPENRKIKRIKDCCVGLTDGTHGTFNRTDVGEVLLSAKNVFEDGLHISDNESTISYEDYYSIISNGYPAKNDILLCCVGTIGRCCIYNYDRPFAFQRSVIFIRCNKNVIIPKMMLYCLSSINLLNQEKIFVNKSAQDGLYQGAVKQLIIAVPESISEQKEIVNYLDNKTSQIDKILVKIDEEVEKLQQLRKVLINDAVIGKIKVI